MDKDDIKKTVDGAIEEKKADDWLAAFVKKSNEALAKQAEQKKQAPPPDEAAVVEALARKSPTEYDRVRADVAESFGIRVSTLDHKVVLRRDELGASSTEAQLKHWDVEPASEAVDGEALLDSLRAVFCRYIMLPPWADIALPLWVLHAWTHEVCEISPILCLTSPTPRCGKTSVMILLTYLTPRSELAANVSTASIFRYIEAVRPTLLLDEGDTFLSENEEMRGILNSGHTKAGASVVRVVEERGEFVTRRFSTWAPKAIALIKKLADTLADRSVTLRLMRKHRGTKVERLRKRDTEEFKALRSQACRWAADHEIKVMQADPTVPDALHDRAADNWRPLLAIADLAGTRWAELARKAACELTGVEDDGTLNITLLKDLRAAFGNAAEMRSVDLVAALTADPEAPWAEYNRGKSITQRQLAKLLGQFGVISVTVHPPGLSHGKGYRMVDLEPLWASYDPPPSGQNDPFVQIPDSEACERASADEMGTTSDFSSVRNPPSARIEKLNLSYSHAGLHVRTDKNGGEARKGVSDQPKGQREGGGATAPVDDGIPDFLRRTDPRCNPKCAFCEGSDPPPRRCSWGGEAVLLHADCEEYWVREHEADDVLDPRWRQ